MYMYTVYVWLLVFNGSFISDEIKCYTHVHVHVHVDDAEIFTNRITCMIIFYFYLESDTKQENTVTQILWPLSI